MTSARGQAAGGQSARANKCPPLSPREGRLSDGRRVRHFRPTLWDRWTQRLEVTSGEWLPDQPVPLLKKRKQLTREQAIALWRQKRQEGWRACAPQWHPPPPPRA